jgi:hypothetical protein
MNGQTKIACNNANEFYQPKVKGGMPQNSKCNMFPSTLSSKIEELTFLLWWQNQKISKGLKFRIV